MRAIGRQQELARPGSLPSFREVVNRVRMIGITKVSLESSQPGAANRLVDQLHLGVVGVDDVRLKHT